MLQLLLPSEAKSEPGLSPRPNSRCPQSSTGRGDTATPETVTGTAGLGGKELWHSEAPGDLRGDRSCQPGRI